MLRFWVVLSKRFDKLVEVVMEKAVKNLIRRWIFSENISYSVDDMRNCHNMTTSRHDSNSATTKHFLEVSWWVWRIVVITRNYLLSRQILNKWFWEVIFIDTHLIERLLEFFLLNDSIQHMFRCDELVTILLYTETMCLCNHHHYVLCQLHIHVILLPLYRFQTSTESPRKTPSVLPLRLSNGQYPLYILQLLPSRLA